jgi:hypothetical protein
MIATQPDETSANARRPQSAELASRSEPAVWGGAILSRAIPLQVRDVIARWRRRIIGTAIVLAALILTLAHAGSLLAGRDGLGSPTDFAELWGILVLLNWPYVILAARVRRHVLQHWLSARSLAASLGGGLLGLSASYLLGYGVVIVAAVNGTGGAIVLAVTAVAVICPLLGALFASTGLQHGLALHGR